MLTQITIPFESREKIRYTSHAASLFHGLLMEQLPAEYADVLHENAQRPFSQSILPQEGGGVWKVSLLTAEDAARIVPALMQLKTAEILQKKDVLTFAEPAQQSISYADLFRRHYIMSDPPGRIRLYFETPAAFKSGGQYLNMPTARLILHGLVRRYDMTCGIHDTVYDTLFDEIEQRVTISGFRIRSASFSLESVRIPAFLGEITLRVSGNQVFRSYINMLCDYAQYAGVGIKTALGMGRVKYEPFET